MWISKLFRRPRGIDRTDEPRGLPESAQAPPAAANRSAEAAFRVADHDAGDDEDESIFGLLGSRLHADNKAFDQAHERDLASQDAGTLLGALYVHYCKALEAPHALNSGTWTAADSRESAKLRYETVDDPAWNKDAGGAITGMFPDIENLEDAFGLRHGARADVAQPDAVPEILRLFAPRDYVQAARPANPLPPALTRREHHTLALDSPLAELNASAQELEERTP